MDNSLTCHNLTVVLTFRTLWTYRSMLAKLKVQKNNEAFYFSMSVANQLSS